MKSFNQISLVVFIFMLASVSIFSQNIQYSYDGNGNRIQRKLFVGPGQRAAPPGGDTTKTDKKADEIAKKNGISVSPNPTKDQVNITINKNNNTDKNNSSATLYLIDNNGRILSQQIQSGSDGYFDLSSFKSGIYYIHIQLKDESLYYKVIKVD